MQDLTQQLVPVTPFIASQAVSSNTTAVFWTKLGDGSFVNPAVLNPTYIPGPLDLANGTFNLYMTGMGIAPCGNTIDTLVVLLAPKTVAFAGENDTICTGTAYHLVNATVENADSTLWTTTGDGNFNDSSVLHPYYIPGPNDIINGLVTLTLTAFNPAIYCNDSSYSITIYIKAAPIAVVSGNEAVCAGDTVQLTAGGGGNYVWSPAEGLSDDSIANPLAFPAVYYCLLQFL